MFRKILPAMMIIASLNICNAQSRSYQNSVYNLLNDVAKAYLLNASRPFVEIETDIAGKHKVDLKSYPSGGSGYFSYPVYAKYGLSKRINFTACTYLYNTAYSLSGKTSTGFGDSYAGIVYEFQKSKMFQHFIQPTIKIPTANSQNGLGTGKVDYDIGVAENFQHKSVGNDFTADINFVARENFPSFNSVTLPPRTVHLIDSISKNYNYSFEQILTCETDPTYNFTKKFLIEGTAIYSRNMRLNLSYVNLTSDLDYTFFKKLELYAGVNYIAYKQLSYSETNFYLGVYYYPSDNVTLGLSNSSGVDQNTGNLITGEIDFSN